MKSGENAAKLPRMNPGNVFCKERRISLWEEFSMTTLPRLR
jgi:hypothetical protein